MKKNKLDIAKKLLSSGELVIFPTETVFGLGADATNDEAVKSIFKVKKRPSSNPIICHFKSIKQIEKYFFLSEFEKKLGSKFWPGPLTIILKKRKNSKISNFVSNNSLLGSWVEANQSDSILRAISSDEEFSDDLIKNYFANESSAEKSFLLGVDIFYKSLELKSFNSAESILKNLNTQFSSENFQVPIFNLLADLRDSKYHNLANSQVLLSIENPPNCSIQSLQFFVSILGGPEINLSLIHI